MPHRTLPFCSSRSKAVQQVQKIAKARSQELDVNALVHLLKVGYISHIQIKGVLYEAQANQKTPWYRCALQLFSNRAFTD